MEEQTNHSYVELMMFAVVETMVEGVHVAVLVEFLNATARQILPVAVFAPGSQRFAADHKPKNGRWCELALFTLGHLGLQKNHYCC